MEICLAIVAVTWAAALQGEAETAARIERHIARLASDEMEGRAPGTPGGEAAARYIAEELEAAGLTPSLQPVPLVGHRSVAGGDELVVVGENGARSVALEDYALSSDRPSAIVELEDAPLFVGYGIVDPAGGRDDYGGADPSGRLVALLPGGAEGYLGRDEEKLRAARRKGASGVVLLVAEKPDREELVGFERLSPGWRDETALDAVVEVLGTALVPPDRVAELEEGAHRGDPPIDLGIRLGVTHRQRVRRFTAPNVVAVLPGADPEAGAVLVTAHYDAYGVGPASDDGDAIYNGALDNAAGTGALIELARRFAATARTEGPLRRMLVFVATTAEERGSLGMSYYLDEPAVPIGETLVGLNIDGLNLYGTTDDFFAFPSEGTSADAALVSIGRRVGMRLTREPWQSGMHFSFDTRPLFERGLVGLTLWQGSSYRGLTEEELGARLRRFGRPHTREDEWPGSGDREAVEQHLALYVAAIEHWAGDGKRPELSPPGLLAPAR